MASLPIGVLLDFVSNQKVQDTAVKAFDAVYSRIFKVKSEHASQLTIDVTPLTIEQSLIIKRLEDIEKQLQSMPSDAEMAAAFSALQAELRIGQRRLAYFLIPSFLVNIIVLSIIYVRN
jgi:hypothetical protein